MKVPDAYLGDGVYASFDGHAIALDLRAQDSTTRIVLEPEVLDNLRAFAQRCYAPSEAGDDGRG